MPLTPRTLRLISILAVFGEECASTNGVFYEGISIGIHPGTTARRYSHIPHKHAIDLSRPRDWRFGIAMPISYTYVMKVFPYDGNEAKNHPDTKDRKIIAVTADSDVRRKLAS